MLQVDVGKLQMNAEMPQTGEQIRRMVVEWHQMADECRQMTDECRQMTDECRQMTDELAEDKEQPLAEKMMQMMDG